jgi:hypothetical protein
MPKGPDDAINELDAEIDALRAERDALFDAVRACDDALRWLRRGYWTVIPAPLRDALTRAGDALRRVGCEPWER